MRDQMRRGHARCCGEHMNREREGCAAGSGGGGAPARSGRWGMDSMLAPVQGGAPARARLAAFSFLACLRVQGVRRLRLPPTGSVALRSSCPWQWRRRVWRTYGQEADGATWTRRAGVVLGIVLDDD